MKNRKNSITAIMIIVIAILVLMIGIIANYFSNRISSNPVGTIGNSAGNLNNLGLFCEHEGTVYFSNSYDNNSLYSMTPAEGKLHKLNDVNVCNLLAGGDYLYYFRSGATGDAGLGSIRSVKSFNRCLLNGRDTTALTRDVVTKAQLENDTLYMLVAGDSQPEFYRMGTDKSDKTLLADYEINPACAENGTIYYNGTQSEHYLYGLDTATDTPYEIWKGNIWYPVKQDDYVYFMDVAENYRLCRYSLTEKIVEVLSNDRIDCFNVNHGYIYYQTNGNTPQLKCMRTDGTGLQIIAEGIYTNINMTSQYVYFQEFGDNATMYHSSLGSTGYEEFSAARTAALAK